MKTINVGTEVKGKYRGFVFEPFKHAEVHTVQALRVGWPWQAQVLVQAARWRYCSLMPLVGSVGLVRATD